MFVSSIIALHLAGSGIDWTRDDVSDLANQPFGWVFIGAMPASGLLVSYIWLGDTFYWIHLVGFAFVMGGIGMVSWAHYRSEKIAQQQGKEYDTCPATPC